MHNTCTILPRSLVSFLCSPVWRKTTPGKQHNRLLFRIYFITGFKISTKCLCAYSCHVVVVWYSNMNYTKKLWDIWLYFSNTRLWWEETNMAVASKMTCKIGLIWRHMKTLYNPMKSSFYKWSVLEAYFALSRKLHTGPWLVQLLLGNNPQSWVACSSCVVNNWHLPASKHSRLVCVWFVKRKFSLDYS